jgi:hypothetical protein
MTTRALRTQFFILCLLACGCGKDTSPVDGPGIDIETELKPGMAPEAVFNLLGKPDSDETPQDYDPPVIREVKYEKLGLSLNFHTSKGLGKIWIDRRWNNTPVHGYRKDDILPPGEWDYEKEGLAVHIKSEVWSTASLYFDKVEVEQGGQKMTGGKVRAIMLMDDKIHGVWWPRFGVKKR